MTERETVIEELEDAMRMTLAQIGNKYRISYLVLIRKCISDALELLINQREKERDPAQQEPETPGMMQDADGIWCVCKGCGEKLWRMFGETVCMDKDRLPKFCPQCGKPVRWK